MAKQIQVKKQSKKDAPEKPGAPTVNENLARLWFSEE